MERKGGEGGRDGERARSQSVQGWGLEGEVAPAPRVKGELRLEGGGRGWERVGGSRSVGGWEPRAVFSILS